MHNDRSWCRSSGEKQKHLPANQQMTTAVVVVGRGVGWDVAGVDENDSIGNEVRKASLTDGKVYSSASTQERSYPEEMNPPFSPSDHLAPHSFPPIWILSFILASLPLITHQDQSSSRNFKSVGDIYTTGSNENGGVEVDEERRKYVIGRERQNAERIEVRDFGISRSLLSLQHFFTVNYLKS